MAIRTSCQDRSCWTWMIHAVLVSLLMGASAAFATDCPEDLNGDGHVDGVDLARVLAAWGPCVPVPATTFSGSTARSDGSPIPGAVIITNLGGTASSGKTAQFSLEASIPASTTTITLTAVASIDGQTLMGQLEFSPVVPGSVNTVGVVTLSLRPACDSGFAWLPRGVGAPGLGSLYSYVQAMCVFDDGTGPALIVGGSIDTANGIVVNGIAKWNGATWSSLGSGVAPTSNARRVDSLAVFDDGTGSALYVGGEFASAGGLAATKSLARWNGVEWSSVGGGVGGVGSRVQSLHVFDDGSGPALYVAGSFGSVGNDLPASNIAKWDGTSWTSLSLGTNGPVNALEVFDDGSGAALVAGGSFTSAGFVLANRIAKWNGTSWAPLGTGLGSINGDSVNSLAVFSRGEETVLVAGGDFRFTASTPAGPVLIENIASWNGTGWSVLGLGVFGEVYSLCTFDEGDGPGLFVGGSFFQAGGVSGPVVNRIARWDGHQWTGLDGGIPTNGSGGSVNSICGFDDDADGVPSLFVGGYFSAAGGVVANRVAEWGCP